MRLPFLVATYTWVREISPGDDRYSTTDAGRRVHLTFYSMNLDVSELIQNWPSDVIIAETKKLRNNTFDLIMFSGLIHRLLSMGFSQMISLSRSFLTMEKYLIFIFYISTVAVDKIKLLVLANLKPLRECFKLNRPC